MLLSGMQLNVIISVINMQLIVIINKTDNG